MYISIMGMCLTLKMNIFIPDFFSFITPIIMSYIYNLSYAKDE